MKLQRRPETMQDYEPYLKHLKGEFHVTRVMELYDLFLHLPGSTMKEFQMRAPLPILVQVLSLDVGQALDLNRETALGLPQELLAAGKRFSIAKAKAPIGKICDVYGNFS